MRARALRWWQPVTGPHTLAIMPNKQLPRATASPLAAYHVQLVQKYLIHPLHSCMPAPTRQNDMLDLQRQQAGCCWQTRVPASKPMHQLTQLQSIQADHINVGRFSHNAAQQKGLSPGAQPPPCAPHRSWCPAGTGAPGAGSNNVLLVELRLRDPRARGAVCFFKAQCT